MPRAWWWWPSWWAPPAASATNCCASSSCSTWPAPWPGPCSWCCSCWWCSRLSTRSKIGPCAIARCPRGPYEHDPEKWEPVFRIGHAQTKQLHVRSRYPLQGCEQEIPPPGRARRLCRGRQVVVRDRQGRDRRRAGQDRLRQVDHVQYRRRADRAELRRSQGHRPRPIPRVRIFRGKIGIVFQNDRLMPWRSALDNVRLGLQILDTDAGQANETARRWLARLGLSKNENDYPHALSGGMRQRVSIARAFAVDPEILLCDEPFSSLDEMTARDLRAEFVRLVRQNNKTAVFITHQINEAMEIGDRVLVFHHPARIAYETRLDAATTEDARRKVHEDIMRVLSVEQVPT